jgi:integral membrane sensor domain MASE1
MKSKSTYYIFVVCVTIGIIFYISNLRLFSKALFVSTNDEAPIIFFLTIPFFAFGPLLFASLKFRKLGGSLIIVFSLVQLITVVIQFKDRESAELFKFIARYIVPQVLIGACILATNYFDKKL